MYLLFWLSLIGTLAYLALLLRYLYHWCPNPEAGDAATPFFSIVVPVRNEADAIEDCIQALLDQDYPGSQYEIIVIDDLSDDGTNEILKKFKGIKIYRTDPKTGGKKEALSLGVSKAKGDLIAITDGDCIVPPGWLRSFASAFSTDIKLATGPVLIARTRNFSERFQALDLASLAMVTASGIQSGLHHLGNGANMAFRKDAYLEVLGFESGKNYASGDDLFLIQSIAAKYPGSIAYVWNKTFVATQASDSVRSFFSQRMRWASKNHALPESQIQYIWVGIWLLYTVLSIYILLSIAHSTFHTMAAIMLLISIFIVQYIALFRVTSYYGLAGQLKDYPLHAIVHFSYVLAMGFLTPFAGKYNWKGRRVR